MKYASARAARLIFNRSKISIQMQSYS